MNQSFPSFHLGDLASASLAKLDGKIFFVEAGGLRYPAKLKLLEGADKLFIILNGFVDRSKTSLPVFARWNWGKILGGHVLAVCDPTLYLDEKLRVGWFLGTCEKHAIIGLISLAETVRNKIGISPSNQVFYGSSAGGFAAIVAAGLSPKDGMAIAINPQIDIFSYKPKAVDVLRNVLGGEERVAISRLSFPERWSAIAAISKGRDAGFNPRIVIAQNTVDDFHHSNHYLPFVRTFGVPEIGGVDFGNNILSMIYTSPEGHGSEPPELVQRITGEAIPFLCTQAVG